MDYAWALYAIYPVITIVNLYRMPLRIDKKYIEELEAELHVEFPELYKCRMISKNGGVIETNTHVWYLYPFHDKSNHDKIIRTFQHIGIENTDMWIWETFPLEAVAIGKNIYGDFLLLLPKKDQPGRLSDTIHVWSRNTGEVYVLAENISRLEDKKTF